MADSIEDRVGQRLGNYRLLRLLRRESTTDVYLGEHTLLKWQAAIKVLSEQLPQQELESFLAQMRMIARLKHPNIPRILEFGVEDRTPFLVTEYASNTSLRQLYPPGSQVPPDKIASYVKQVAAALHYIHAQGLVHEGVRPENMLLGSQDRVLLGDFGTTIDALGTTRSLQYDEEGALDYEAPELFMGRASPASDQYALGMVVYEWLNGALPFHRSSSEIEQRSLTPILLQTKMPTVSPELAKIIATALAQDPQQRFADIAAFANALEPLLQPPPLPDTTSSHESTPPVQPAPPAPVLPPRKRHTRPGITRAIGISLVLLILLIIGGVFSFSRQRTTITPAQATQTAVAKRTQQAVATFTSRPSQAIYTTVTSGKPLIDDPLNNKSKSTWGTIQGAGYSCNFNGGIYTLQMSNAHAFLNCQSGAGPFHNFAFQTDMSIAKGFDSGLTFRSNSASSRHYSLSIAPADSTTLCVFALNIGIQTKQLQSTSLDIHPQNFNTITVIAYENVFYFYANKKLVMQAQDSTLQSGSVGTYVENSTTSVTKAVFRNAKLWSL